MHNAQVNIFKRVISSTLAAAICITACFESFSLDVKAETPQAPESGASADNTVSAGSESPSAMDAVVESGTCGDNLSYKLTSDGVLTVSGSGNMYNYDKDYTDKRAPWYANRARVKKVVIGNSVTSIGSGAFAECINLTSVSIGSGVTFIGGYAFYNCVSLSNISIPKNVKSVGEYAFRYCSSMTVASVAYGCETMGDYVFANCKKLEKVTLPNSLTSLGTYAFYNCSKLKSVTVPSGLSSVPYCAFKNCVSLKTVVLKNGPGSIGIYAFEDCDSLEHISIPESYSVIGDYAFRYCDSLKSIVFTDTITRIHSGALVSCDSLTSIYYEGSSAAWKDLCSSDYNGTVYYNFSADDYIPQNVKASGVAGGVRLTWSKVTGATHYRVQRYTSSGWKTIGYPTATSYTVSGLTAGTKYRFRVLSCVRGDVWSTPCASVYAKALAATAPQNLKGTAGNRSAKLTWTKVSGATRYRVQHYTSSGWKSVAYPTTNSCTVKGLKNGGKYVYRVLAYTGSWSKPSAKVQVIPRAGTAPQNLTAAAGSGYAKLSWSRVSGAVKYRVQHYSSSGWKTVAYPTSNTCRVTGLKNNGKYVYRVLAYVNGAWSSPSSKVQVIPRAGIVPQVTAYSGNSSALLTWYRVNGAEKYRVQHYTSSGWKTVAYPTANTYTATGLKNGGKYVYRVLSYVDGKWSDASAKVQVIPHA